MLTGKTLARSPAANNCLVILASSSTLHSCPKPKPRNQGLRRMSLWRSHPCQGLDPSQGHADMRRHEGENGQHRSAGRPRHFQAQVCHVRDGKHDRLASFLPPFFPPPPAPSLLHLPHRPIFVHVKFQHDFFHLFLQSCRRRHTRQDQRARGMYRPPDVQRGLWQDKQPLRYLSHR